MKILLTGGLGFIGRRFIEKYPNLDDLIIYAPKKSTQITSDEITNQTKIETGLVEENSIFQVFKKYNPKVVIHLASIGGLSNCEKKPFDSFKVNVIGTFNVIRACLKIKSKLIFVSSREVYGETIQESSKENDPLFPKNVYGITKMLGESLVTMPHKNDQLDFTIYRLTNVYGPGGLNGVNKIIKTAVKEKKIMINGSG